MTVEFRLPDVGEGLHEAEVVEWLVKPGDVVTLNQPLVEILTDKSSVELPSPSAGTVTELGADVGDMVTVGELLIVIDDASSTAAPTKAASPLVPPMVVAPTAAAPTSAAVTKEVPNPTPVRTVTAPSAAPAMLRPKASPSTRRLAAERGVDLATIVGTGPGGRILETDIPGADSAVAPPASTNDLTATLAEIDTVLATPSGLPGSVDMVARSLPTPASWPVAPEPTAAPSASSTPTPETQNPDAAPDIAGTSQPATPVGSAVPSRRPVADALGQAEPGVHPLRGVRRMTARAMDLSWSTIPHITATDEIDATALLHSRSQLRDAAGPDAPKITPLTVMMMAVAQGLKRFPLMNAALDLENETITVHEDINVGVAVASSHGLIVPVVKNAADRSVLDMAAEIARLSSEARNKSLSNADLVGGTFTVTNYGSHGGRYATPIIRPGEAAIMGFGGIAKRPFVVGDDVVARPTLPIVLAGDHRLVDGDLLSAFHNFVADALTDPNTILYRAAL